MATPEQTKNKKPGSPAEKEKAEKKGASNDNMKVIIINLMSTLLICVLFLSVNYILQSNLLNSKMAQMTTPADENADDSTSDETDQVQKGFILDLGDFVLNLSDVAARKYLKVNVALEVSNKEGETSDTAEAGNKEGSKEGGGEGGKEGASASNPLEAEMAQYKPAIRDAVITTLSSKTSTELATVAGKELAKE